jgi:AcrR family transcriptional regulator
MVCQPILMARELSIRREPMNPFKSVFDFGVCRFTVVRNCCQIKGSTMPTLQVVMTGVSPKSSNDKKQASRTYGGLSEAERVLERRERFLEAGLDVFGRVGLRGATVRGLCKAAGLTERYFYESFEDTDDLFCAVYEKQTAVLRDFFIAEVPQMPRDLHARVRTALDLYYSMMRDERRVRVLYTEVMGASPRVSAMHNANVLMGAQMAAFLLRTDNPELVLSDDQALCLGYAINGACTTLVVQWMAGGYAQDQRLVVESCSTIVFGTVNELRRQTEALRQSRD